MPNKMNTNQVQDNKYHITVSLQTLKVVEWAGHISRKMLED